ncbi:MAG: carboxypeptidase regulatory-like domain-containing protein, partial [Acidobacteria bacterium]|nr:carboxypeptidase regulatory-like domain-containing protein [Acidobacteriota bacterium]
MLDVKSTLRRGAFAVVCVLAALLWVTGPVAAQQPTGTILGVVKDATGGVIPGASVTITATDTGMMRTGMTGADGAYRFPALPVGNYEVRVEH